MFSTLYTFGVRCYGGAIGLASHFMLKARLRHRGGNAALASLQQVIDVDASYVWFHAASLGEFEQGRPVIETFRELYPSKKILLTFFSPSGYEVRKHYSGADVVCYLPLDTPDRVQRFLDIVNPEMAIFIKYEFWANYLWSLKKRGIPTFIISAIFRPNQVFFRWYGVGFRKLLGCFTRIFVQDVDSQVLLKSIGVEHVQVVGDTRFDRVVDIASQAKQLDIAKAFSKDATVLVAGSTWGPDEEFLIRYVNTNKEKKLILVPHEVESDRIMSICSKMRCSYVLYTQTTPELAAKANCLIVDTIGVLSSLYQYGEVAYVGGGFGVGIHNVLEAAVWKMPVVFGPNYSKFREARELIEQKGAFSISTYRQFEDLVNRLFIDHQVGKIAGNYVQSHKGATQMIINELFNVKY